MRQSSRLSFQPTGLSSGRGHNGPGLRPLPVKGGHDQPGSGINASQAPYWDTAIGSTARAANRVPVSVNEPDVGMGQGFELRESATQRST
ncbi:MAG: hypothetical protein AAF514_16865, partial [Verrucomicrobiota bacterium]